MDAWDVVMSIAEEFVSAEKSISMVDKSVSTQKHVLRPTYIHIHTYIQPLVQQ